MLSKNQRSFKNRTIKLIKDLLTGMPNKLKDENVIKFFRYPEKDFVTLYFFFLCNQLQKKSLHQFADYSFWFSTFIFAWQMIFLNLSVSNLNHKFYRFFNDTL